MRIVIATEDELSEVVALRLVGQAYDGNIEITKMRKNGFGYLRSHVAGFSQIARKWPILIFTDLDRGECAPALVEKWWAGVAQPRALSFRVAVRSIESWLLADRPGIAGFLGVSSAKISTPTDAIPEPKRYLLNLARGARRSIKRDLLPEKGARASQGFGYNRCLCHFVSDRWSPDRAAGESESLFRARRSIGRLLAAV